MSWSTRKLLLSELLLNKWNIGKNWLEVEKNSEDVGASGRSLERMDGVGSICTSCKDTDIWAGKGWIKVKEGDAEIGDLIRISEGSIAIMQVLGIGDQG